MFAAASSQAETKERTTSSRYSEISVYPCISSGGKNAASVGDLRSTLKSR